MMQLRKGRARHHIPDRLECAVRTNAASVTAHAEPDRSTLLYGSSQGAIVDQLAANRVNAANALQRFRSDKNAAPVRTRSPGCRISDPLWRV